MKQIPNNKGPIMLVFTKKELEQMLKRIPVNTTDAKKNKEKIEKALTRFEYFVGVMEYINNMSQLLVLDTLVKSYRVVEPIVGFKNIQIYGVKKWEES